jgi:hypothetical protein
VSASLLLAVTALAAAACPPPTFTFVGQPPCVAVTFEGDHTRLTSTCDGPLLVDRSVASASGGVVMPGETALVRDLSAFTLGLDGELHRVVATLDPAECEAAPEAPPAPVDPSIVAGFTERLRGWRLPFLEVGIPDGP